MKKLHKRIEWIDQLKGLGIFLVVYGHNFPMAEKYIYSFHMPLFFLISGIFHPKVQNLRIIAKRFKFIIIPYLLWSFSLYLFWLFLGRFYGESQNYDLSVYKNFIGVFYAQGDRFYMDWGIPMWFLPTLFLTFLNFYLAQLIKNPYLKCFLLITLIFIGFTIPKYFDVKFIWSLDVSLVSLVFYSFGYYSSSYLKKIETKYSWLIILILGIVHLTLFNLNIKIDMYRSIYGNDILFIFNGLIGSLFYIFLIKELPKIKVLSLMGKFTIPILALQIRALTFIKLCLILVLGLKVFEFTEFEKFVLSVFQICLIIPFAFLFNKYIPIINGGYKKI